MKYNDVNGRAVFCNGRGLGQLSVVFSGLQCLFICSTLDSLFNTFISPTEVTRSVMILQFKIPSNLNMKLMD